MLNPRKRQCESRKLSTEQKLKVLKLYDEYTADPFPFSKRVIASKIGGQLNRNLDPKSVRNILAERANIESGGAHRNFYQTQTPEWQQWETQLDEKLKAAFEWGNLTIGFICQIALSFVRLNPARASFRRTAVKVSLNLRVIKPTRLAVSKNRNQ